MGAPSSPFGVGWKWESPRNSPKGGIGDDLGRRKGAFSVQIMRSGSARRKEVLEFKVFVVALLFDLDFVCVSEHYEFLFCVPVGTVNSCSVCQWVL